MPIILGVVLLFCIHVHTTHMHLYTTQMGCIASAFALYFPQLQSPHTTDCTWVLWPELHHPSTNTGCGTCCYEDQV